MLNMGDIGRLRTELSTIRLRLYQLEMVYEEELQEYLNSQDYAKYICGECKVGMRLGLRSLIDLDRWFVFQTAYGYCFGCIYDSYIRQRRIQHMDQLEKDMKKRRRILSSILEDIDYQDPSSMGPSHWR